VAARQNTQPDELESAAIGKSGASIGDRIAAFVMIDAMRDATQAEKSLRLKLIGFGNAEIATMLQTSPAVVASNIYAERQRLLRKVTPRKRSGTKTTDGGRADGSSTDIVETSGDSALD
jgi:hypothetical protein